MKVTLDDIDDLIGALSPDELKELSSVDPDVSMDFKLLVIANGCNRNH